MKNRRGILRTSSLLKTEPITFKWSVIYNDRAVNN